MKDVEFIFKDNNKLIIDTDRSTIQEMSEHFSFFAEGYKFNPKFKQRRWDGKIKLVHSGTQTAGVGLLKDLVGFCKSNQYSYSIDPRLKPKDESNIDLDGFISSLALPFTPRDYQLKAVKDCIKYQRMGCQSPTGCLDPSTKILAKVTPPT